MSVCFIESDYSVMRLECHKSTLYILSFIVYFHEKNSLFS